MKKATVLLLVFVLLVGMLPLSMAAAAPVSDLTSLAAYMPADTSMYIGLRTDDAFIAELDGLLNLVVNRLPAGAVPPINLNDLLDMGIANAVPGGDFRSVVRSWLGDTAAIGVLNLAEAYNPVSLRMEDPPVVFAASVTNRAAVEELVDLLVADLLDAGLIERGEEGPFTTYKMTGRQPGNASILIGDDVLLVVSGPLESVLQFPGGSLADNEAFTGAFDLLPAESYNILVYADTQGIIDAQTVQFDADPAMAELAELLPYQMNPVAVGLTVLDGHVLTIDIATLVDMEAVQAGGVMLPVAQPIDPAFTELLPADAQYVVLGTGIWSAYQSLLANLQMAMEAQGEDPEEMYGQLEMAGAVIEQMVGLDYEDDILAWMTGDFALYFSADLAFVDSIFEDPGALAAVEDFPLEFGFLVAATDGVAAQNVIAQLSDTLPALLEQNPSADVAISQETIAGSSVLVFTLPVEDATMGLDTVDFLLGANDEVFVLGTRGAVTAALDPQVDNLRNSPGVEAATPYLLDQPNSVWYVSTDGVGLLGEFVMLTLLGPSIGNIFDNIVTELEAGTPPPTMTPEEREQQDLEALQEMQMMRGQVQQFFSLIENLTISTSVHADGVSLARLTLSLAAE